MSITVNYPFDTPSNYTYDSTKIDITGSKAALKLIDNSGNNFTQNFTNDAGHVYDSTLEFSGGLLQQVNQRPTNATAYASFTNGKDFAWGDGILTGTLNNGATVSGGQADCSGFTNKNITWASLGNADAQQILTVVIGVRPQYSGSPSENNWIFSINKNNGTLKNAIEVVHLSTGSILVTIYDQNTNPIINGTIVAWNPVANQLYQLALVVDITTGATKLYIDGSQVGSTQAATGTRSSDFSIFCLGCNATQTGNCNSIYDYAIVFDAAISISPTVPDLTDFFEYDYLEGYDLLPEMEYTGAGTLISFDSLTSTVIGSMLIALQIGRSGVYTYWNGSAWVTGDGTKNYMCSVSDFASNVATLDIEGEIYGQFKIYFPNSNSQGSIDILTASLTAQKYSIDNPTVKSITAIKTKGIKSISITETNSGLSVMKYTVEVGGVEKYWNGSSWAVSSGVLQSNTKTDLETNIASLNLSLGTSSFYLIAYLHSEDGSATPEVSLITIVYDFHEGEAITPTLCVVWGYIHDITDEPVENVTITVKLLNNANYSDEILVTTTVKTVTPDALGYWDISLFRSEELDPETQYMFRFSSTKFKLTGIKTVPLELSKSYLELED